MAEADLHDVDRLQSLFSVAIARGVLRGSEHDWVNFVAMAQHVIRRAATGHVRSPVAVFCSNVNIGDYEPISGEDEDAASAALRAWRYST